jgi:hypothetical protein
MPRKNFKNIGELQGYEYLKGVITDDPDLDADTCTVKIKDSDGNDTEFEDTPIFYHCSEDAEEREDNGAIEGAAFGFVKDEGVIVLKQRQGAPGHDGEPAEDPKIFVIGHLSGIAPCCFIEPWDGPELFTKWPWIHQAYIGIEESYFNIRDRTSSYPDVFTYDSIVDGSLIIDSPAFQVAAPYNPLQGPGVYYEQQMRYQLSGGAYIREKARKVLFDAEDYERLCYNPPGTQMSHNYMLYLDGKGPGGIDIEFEIVVLWNSSELFARIGCTDIAPAETEWATRTDGSFTIYRKNILSNNTDWIDLPRTDVDIYGVNVYMAQYNLDYVHPVGGLFPIDAGYFKINNIIVC